MQSPFTSKATTSAGGGTEVPAAGAHLARVVAMIDLGSHEEAYQGKKPQLRRKVFIVYELVNETKSGSTERHVIAECYRIGEKMTKKNKVREIMERLRGKDFNDDDDISIDKLLGCPCQVTVKHGKSAKGNTYANVADVTQAPKGTQVPKAQHEQILWFIGCGVPIPDKSWIPYCYGDQIGDLIKSSAEWKQLNAGGGNGAGARPSPAGDSGEGEVPAGVGAEEEIPY